MSAIDTGWEADFQANSRLYGRLKDEVVFALNSATRAAGIKTHLIHGRVKEQKSLADKIRNKQYSDPLGEVPDIVGVRAVVLFLSDLPRLDEIITDSFAVTNSEDKIEEGDPATFGYMSVHYVAKLDAGHAGPRYDDLKGFQFEIQTRTVVMDAWANVSHYLDYKGESSIPDDLRRDFFALSGLFYVADQHFETFANRSLESQERAQEELRKDQLGEAPINLDTVAAFLVSHYPDREHSDRSAISTFVEEITKVGYDRVDSLAQSLSAGEETFAVFEERSLPTLETDLGLKNLGPKWYSDIGAARLSLALTDSKYRALKYKDDDYFGLFKDLIDDDDGDDD